jgi:small subunit ribosomal protein S21
MRPIGTYAKARYEPFATVRQAMKVERRDGETVEQLLRRFNKGVVAERITKTYREKMHFVSKSEQRKEKRRRAERNRRKKAMQLH